MLRPGHFLGKYFVSNKVVMVRDFAVGLGVVQVVDKTTRMFSQEENGLTSCFLRIGASHSTSVTSSFPFSHHRNLSVIWSSRRSYEQAFFSEIGFNKESN